jgi:hypothetical protein
MAVKTLNIINILASYVEMTALSCAAAIGFSSPSFAAGASVVWPAGTYLTTPHAGDPVYPSPLAFGRLYFSPVYINAGQVVSALAFNVWSVPNNGDAVRIGLYTSRQADGGPHILIKDAGEALIQFSGQPATTRVTLAKSYAAEYTGVYLVAIEPKISSPANFITMLGYLNDSNWSIAQNFGFMSGQDVSQASYTTVTVAMPYGPLPATAPTGLTPLGQSVLLSVYH